MCRVVLETPVKLSRRQKELLQEFENDHKGDTTEHNPRGESWLSSVREFFERMTS
jgi:molecular chaperone DnaJ